MTDAERIDRLERLVRVMGRALFKAEPKPPICEWCGKLAACMGPDPVYGTLRFYCAAHGKRPGDPGWHEPAWRVFEPEPDWVEVYAMLEDGR